MRHSPGILTPLCTLQAYEDQVSLVRVAQAQVEACEDELNSRAAELDSLQVTRIASPGSLMGITAEYGCLSPALLPVQGVLETCTPVQRCDFAVQARLAEVEDARSAAEAQTAAVREECRQGIAVVQAEAQAAAARARKEADAEIGAAHAEGAAAAVRARQEADSAIAEVRAGAEAAAARAKQEADSSAALIRWAETQA